MDSQIPNDVVSEWLPKSGMFSDNAVYRREYTYGKSRFDIYVEDGSRKAFVEVKGVTLENDGIVSFPDAPTERGVKHLNELITALDYGFECYVIFVVQMKGVTEFKANRERHSEFADALKKAFESGVKIKALDCIVTHDEIKLDTDINVCII